jgi:hypothetical protein
MLKTLFTSALCLLMTAHLLAQKPYTPAVGSAERKAILDIIREPTQKELGQVVQFNIGTFNIMGDWCFIFANIQQTTGKSLDIKKIVKKDLLMGEGDEAFFENNIQVVLKKTKDKWTIVRRVLGCTDVCWSDWYVDLKAPKSVFGLK